VLIEGTPPACAALLPDEPYAININDGPEAFQNVRTEHVSGRLLTWYGPAMVEAAHALKAAPHPVSE